MMPMRRNFLSLVPVLSLFALSTAGAQGKPYQEVIPATASTQRGLFDVHRVGPNLFGAL